MRRNAVLATTLSSDYSKPRTKHERARDWKGQLSPIEPRLRFKVVDRKANRLKDDSSGCAPPSSSKTVLFSAAQFKIKLEPPDQFVMGVSDTNTCCQKTGDEV